MLGIRRLLLGLHDAAFPSTPEEDTGRGTPYGDGAVALLEFAAELGFDGLQLGPQGALPPGHASPYDGAFFSREPTSVALLPLTRPAFGELLDRGWLARRLAGRPGGGARAELAFAREAVHDALGRAFAELERRREAPPVAALARDLEAFQAREAAWLARDAAFEGAPDGEARARYAFAQYLAQAQHAELRERAGALGLALFGDLHAGISARDAHAAAAFLLPGYRMGAPPSRTNPDGQPWHYPLLDPRRYREAGGDGPALRFFRDRVERMFAAYDGLRLDHPHGLVDPWVYRDEGEPGAAVRAGARLFSSPDLEDHPALGPLAVARPDQLRRELPRHADGWVARLDPEQVTRYGVLLDALMAAAARRGLGADAVACEILSTEPYPLARALERHGLGRFRVTQKADLARPEDGYRGENARPEDWIMLGNHDTPTILAAAERWIATGAAPRQAEYLASRLLAPGEPQEAWVRRVAGSAGALVQARAADLFAGPARQVMIFFTDLFGEREPYNVPGTVSPANWSLRLPADFRALYRRRLAEGRALDLPRALARALRSRGAPFAARHEALLAALDHAP
ncbi:hypothetical protein AMYX_01510 [Anaeromyxobacter diazotrophicus]|uniref:4-alpha-glucanotransferase n=1 Tax=Anaeromyxobacter diazotrophicus TaxID=2590199 RepID=A0A7I9VGZ6_9BACT|nr:hypothetical protein AMYX_01510 [Anaeromyxobacter diazotrophicus]